MWLIFFLWLWAPAAPLDMARGGPQSVAPPASTLDYEFFKNKVQPLLAEKRPGHARCITCHSTGTAFRLQRLPAGRTAYTEEESRKNFEAVARVILPGVPAKSRLLTMPLAHEAGGTEFHPGGKHWATQDDPEWKTIADWVKNAAAPLPLQR
jgi:hypothetical protein